MSRALLAAVAVVLVSAAIGVALDEREQQRPEAAHA